ncbi:MAG: hypothetical protein ACLQPD_12955 [Desulfomonilaceae bacterium]
METWLENEMRELTQILATLVMGEFEHVQDRFLHHLEKQFLTHLFGGLEEWINNETLAATFNQVWAGLDESAKRRLVFEGYVLSVARVVLDERNNLNGLDN